MPASRFLKIVQETGQNSSAVSTCQFLLPGTTLYGPGPVQRLSMFELRETGDWHIFLGPPERARADSETGGADQWVFKRRECPGFAGLIK